MIQRYTQRGGLHARIRHDSLSFTARSLPFRGGEFRTRFGELAIAAAVNEGRRLPLFKPPGERYVGECDGCVGVGGSELFVRLGEVVGGDPPAAASVRRNSTQRRENDYAAN